MSASDSTDAAGCVFIVPACNFIPECTSGDRITVSRAHHLEPLHQKIKLQVVWLFESWIVKFCIIGTLNTTFEIENVNLNVKFFFACLEFSPFWESFWLVKILLNKIDQKTGFAILNFSV